MCGWMRWVGIITIMLGGCVDGYVGWWVGERVSGHVSGRVCGFVGEWARWVVRILGTRAIGVWASGRVVGWVDVWPLWTGG